MNEEKVKERLEDLIDTCNKGIEMHPYDKELFETDKTALETVLQLLEQKDKRIDDLEKALVDEDLKHRDKINKVIDKLKLFKNDLKEYDKKYESKKDVPVGAIGIRINELLKILEE